MGDPRTGGKSWFRSVTERQKYLSIPLILFGAFAVSAFVIVVAPQYAVPLLLLAVLFFLAMIGWLAWEILARQWTQIISIVVLVVVYLVAARVIIALGNGEKVTSQPVPVVEATPPVRFYGAQLYDIQRTPAGKRYLYVDLCYANRSDHDVTVWFYNVTDYVTAPRNATEERQIIVPLQDKLARYVNQRRGTNFVMQPEDLSPFQPCDPGPTSGVFNQFSSPKSRFLSHQDITRFYAGMDAFFFVGELLEKDSYGYTEEPFCGIIEFGSAPLGCPGPGSE